MAFIPNLHPLPVIDSTEIPKFTCWCEEATTLMIQFGEMVEKHWEQIEKQAGEDKDIHFDISLLLWNAGQQPANEVVTAKKTKDLCRLIESFPTLDIPPSHGKKGDREAIVLRMYLGLGLWLCTYFNGMARFDLWDDVMLFARRLGTFPGDAFLDKLGGDLFRSERIFHERKGVMLSTKQAEKDDDLSELDKAFKKVLLTMSYAPIVMLRDEFDLLQVTRKIEIEELDGYPDAQKALVGFVRQTDILARRYFRLQVWLYLLEPTNPLLYSVSQWSLREKMENLAADYVWLAKGIQEKAEGAPHTLKEIMDYLSKSRHKNPSPEWETLLESRLKAREMEKGARIEAERKQTCKEWRRELDSATKSDQSEAYQCALDYIKTLSDARLCLFFHGKRYRGQGNRPRDLTPEEKMDRHIVHRQVVVLSETLTRHRGLSSAILGVRDGILANPPHRTGEWAHCCQWIEGLRVAIERDKIKQIWLAIFEGLEREKIGPNHHLLSSIRFERWMKLPTNSILTKDEPQRKWARWNEDEMDFSSIWWELAQPELEELKETEISFEEVHEEEFPHLSAE